MRRQNIISGLSMEEVKESHKIIKNLIGGFYQLSPHARIISVSLNVL